MLCAGGILMAETRTAARMARLVAQWRRSGESAASFARHHRIPTWTFGYWQRKLSMTPAPEPPPAAFVPVQVAVDDGPVIELVFSSGERLRVRAGASPELVRATVSAVRSAC
jgi:hypothetical protein